MNNYICINSVYLLISQNMLKCLTCTNQRDQNSLAFFKLNKTPTSLKYLSSIKQKIGAGLFLSLVIYLLLHFLCPVVKESSIKIIRILTTTWIWISFANMFLLIWVHVLPIKVFNVFSRKLDADVTQSKLRKDR
jgi:hypothetical protein